jgi:carbonic anhydrase
MRTLTEYFEANRRWAAEMSRGDPAFFSRLSRQQSPELLWIGCSDSRLPPNMILGRAPGEIFVHRNVGNVVVHTDMNALSVLQYALDVLSVKHVIVCGHYGCGGIRAALDDRPLGLIDNWLRHIRDVYAANEDEIHDLDDPVKQAERLAELNVRAQVANVCHTTIVQDAWSRGQEVTVHGWIYAIGDGLLHDLGLTVDSPAQMKRAHRISHVPPPP